MRPEIFVAAIGFAVIGTAASETSFAAEVRWERRVRNEGPVARHGFAIAYDVVRDRTVLFGGEEVAIGSLADTWEWDGVTWEEKSPPVSPEKRSGHAMAFDPMRGTVVLFGGLTRDGTESRVLGDSWEWDGETWREIPTVSAPLPRLATALAFDPARGSLLLFGGSDGAASFSDTWELVASGWDRLALSSGPSARNGHALATDSRERRVILFGGVEAPTGWSEAERDTWEWNGESWRRVAETGPDLSNRAPALAFDSRRNVFMLYGFAANDLRRTHDWTGEDEAEWVGTAAAGTSPGGFAGALVFDSARRRCVLVQEVIEFGGEFETWELAPVILEGVTPAIGSDAGGDLVSLDGFRVDGDPEGTRVRFGESEASVVDASEGRLRVRAPIGFGTVDVVIETPAGVSRLADGYRFVPAAIAARFGTVNVGHGDREDVLLVNGEAGLPETRIVEAARGEPLRVEMLPPSSLDEAPFALYAWEEEPTEETLADAPFDVGRTVFPFPFLGTTPRPKAIWNNVGHRSALGVPTHPSEPAPSTVLSQPGGVRRPVTLTFQGIVRDAGSGSPSGWSLTNAVILRVN